MNKLNVNSTSIVATLMVIGAGTLQVAVTLAVIPNEGIRLAFCVAIIASILMDAIVIHSIGTNPSNKIQKGLAITMLACLLIGLSLDVVLLLTHEAFSNNEFGWLRVLVGINITVSMIASACFFAFSDTNTHERAVKTMENEVARQQMRLYLSSQEAADLFAGVARNQILESVSKNLDLPAYAVGRLPETTQQSTPRPSTPQISPQVSQQVSQPVPYRTPVVPTNGNGHKSDDFTNPSSR